VSSFDRVPELVRKALRKSWEGRPGVVHVDVPENHHERQGEGRRRLLGAAPVPPRSIR
jgi:thiamine pyrophosphate-dependent acetolactate synthase large subunit-like protein